MSKHKLSRRQMIRAGAAGLAGAAVSSLSRPALGTLGANDRLRVGIIGPGDRGTGLMGECINECGTYNARLTAVCDLWSVHREKARAFVKKTAGHDPATFRNTEELYNARAADAVIISTPDFSHAILCAEAIRAGMDVYVEKPLAHVMEDAVLVREACEKSDRVVQVGTGLRSTGKYMAAAEFVAEGKLGRINGVEATWHVNQPKRWRREDVVPRLKEEDTDWERYQLNRPRRPFDPRRYLEFRLFWPYSSGLPDQWMSHQIDAVAMISGDPYPVSCVASGGIHQWHDGRENPDSFAAILEYPSGFQVRYSARQTNGYGDMSLRFFSTRGTLDVEENKVSPEGGINRDEGGDGDRLTAASLPKRPDASHMGNWLDCIRRRRRPNADFMSGYGHSVAVSMAVQAWRTGRRITFDPKTHTLREA